ncbi:MAG: hypothetical protein H0X02_13570 [Nitrosomonas sp.]|nr:hypothetical protein [Nitrosomonas sp.]
MKKTVKLLNNREHKDFEVIYQLLSNFPGWKMENVFTSKTFEHNECEKCSRVFYTRDKLNRLSIAAHEADHAIVMAAAYGVVGEAIIDVEGHPEGWLGWVKSAFGQKKDESDYQPIEQDVGMPCKPAVIRAILIESCGFVGESFVGKKIGSNHEKFLIYCRCRHLDERDEVEPLTNWTHYVDWCRKIILNNENLFWRIIDDLLANSEMTDPVKILLHNRVKKESPNLFF